MKNNKNIEFLPQNDFYYKSAARNFFRMISDLDLDKYDYVSFSDQDDIWKPFKLYNAAKNLSRGYEGYSCNVKPFREKKLLKTINKSQKQKKYDYLFEGGGAGSTILINIKIFKEIKNLLLNNKWIVDKINHHDWFIYAYTRYHYDNWLIDKAENVYYRQHSRNELGTSYSFFAFKKRVKFVLSGYAFQQSYFIAKSIGIKSDIIKNIYLNRFSNLFILINFNQFRRSPKGKLLMLIICIISLIYPINKKNYD